MSNYNPVYTSIWSDIKFTEYTSEQQLIFLYLITNKNCKVSGIYQVSPKEIAFSTNIDKNTVIDSLKSYDIETLDYDAAAGIVFIKNHFRYNMNQIGNPKVMLKSLIKNSELIPHPTFWDDFTVKYKKELGGLALKAPGLEGNDSTLSQHLAKTYLTLSQDLANPYVEVEVEVDVEVDTINSNKITNSNTPPEPKPKSKLKFNDFQLQVAKQLGEHIKSMKQINLKMKDIKRWANDIRLLQEIDLKPRSDSKKSIEKVMKAIVDNAGVEFFPEIESGKTFRDKFLKVEGFLVRKDKPKKGKSSTYNYKPRAMPKKEADALQRTHSRMEIAKKLNRNPDSLTPEDIQQHQQIAI